MTDGQGRGPLPPPGGPARGGTPPPPAGSSLPPPVAPPTSPQRVAQQAAHAPRPDPAVRGPMAPRAAAPPPAAPAPAPKARGRGTGALVKVAILLGAVVGLGAVAGTYLSSVDAVVVVEDQTASLPDWFPFAVAGGVVVAGFVAFLVGGPRPELLPSWVGLALVTYGSGLGLERLQELDSSGRATEVLAQLDTTESVLAAGAALVLVGQALAIKRWLSPRPIAAVRALLGTGLLTALAVAVATTSVLSAEVTVGA